MKQWQRFFAVVLAAALILPAGIASAGGYNLAGVGAKALSMSGSFRAIADDWSATYWNPAGLAGQATSITLEAKALYPLVWITPNVTSPYVGYEGYVNGVEQSSREKAFPSGAFGLTYQLNEKMTAAFSVFAPSALGADFTGLYTGPPYGYNNTVPFPDDAWFSDMKVIDMHPAVGYQATDQLSLGLGISIQYATVTLRSPSQIPTGAPFPVEHFYATGELEGTGVGFGFNVGAKYDATEQLHIGLCYRGPLTIPLSGTMTQALYLPYSPGVSAALAADADPARAALAPLFLGGKRTSTPDGDADLPIPMEFGAGIAYDVNEQLTIAADFNWVNWATADKIEIKVSGNDPTGQPAEDQTIVLDYEDTIRLNVGLSYVVIPDQFELYAGYYLDPTPIPDGTVRPTITDVADKHNLSIGAGYWINENLLLQPYWEHVWSGERTVGMIDIDSNGTIDNLAGDWKMQVDTFGFQLGYRF